MPDQAEIFAGFGPARPRWKSYLIAAAVAVPLLMATGCVACLAYVEYQCQVYADC